MGLRFRLLSTSAITVDRVTGSSDPNNEEWFTSWDGWFLYRSPLFRSANVLSNHGIIETHCMPDPDISQSQERGQVQSREAPKGHEGWISHGTCKEAVLQRPSRARARIYAHSASHQGWSLCLDEETIELARLRVYASALGRDQLPQVPISVLVALPSTSSAATRS